MLVSFSGCTKVTQLVKDAQPTKADGLSVRVKVNEAEMTLTKVEDGLSLARMLLDP